MSLRRWSILNLVIPLIVPAIGLAKDPESKADIEKLAKTYKVDIVIQPKFPVKTTHGPFDGKVADGDKIDKFFKLFQPEFSMYPAELIKKSQLKKIVLCTGLSFSGQIRTASPNYEEDAIYIDVVRGDYDKSYVRKVIHHEFFHVFDWKDDGHVYKDERWALLNPMTFKYGTGGKDAQDNENTSVLTDKYPGFLNHYSTMGVEEDKAEIFANLMVDPGYVKKRAEKDKVLNTKVERMKELMKTFCPDVTEKFWDNAEKMKRSDK